MASINQNGPTEIQDFAKDVTTLYADDSKIDGSEIEQLKQKYVDEFFYSVGDDEIDTADEIAAVVRDINFDGIVDNSHNYSELKLNSGEKDKCYIGSPAYDRTVFSDAFIEMVRKEIGSKPLEAAKPREEAKIKQHNFQEFVDLTEEILSANHPEDKVITQNHQVFIARHKQHVSEVIIQKMMELLTNPEAQPGARKNAAMYLRALNIPEVNKQILDIAADPAQPEGISNLAIESLKFVPLRNGDSLADFIAPIRINTSDLQYFENTLNAILKDSKASEEKKAAVREIAKYQVTLVNSEGGTELYNLNVPRK